MTLYCQGQIDVTAPFRRMIGDWQRDSGVRSIVGVLPSRFEPDFTVSGQLSWSSLVAHNLVSASHMWCWWWMFPRSQAMELHT